MMLCSYVHQYKVVTLRNKLALMAAHFLRLQGLVSDENDFANRRYDLCTDALLFGINNEREPERGDLVLSVNISIIRKSVGNFVRSPFYDHRIKIVQSCIPSCCHFSLQKK